MRTIGSDQLLSKYGSPLAIAEALIEGRLESHEQGFVSDLVSPIVLQAANMRIRRTRRASRQRAVFKWVRETFGEEAATPRERALRLLEEVVELVQAEGLPPNLVQTVVNHVYSKATGKPEQEVGGVGVTLLAYCESRGISASIEERREFSRVLSIDKSHFRARHNVKAAAGIAAPAPEPGA